MSELTNVITTIIMIGLITGVILFVVGFWNKNEELSSVGAAFLVAFGIFGLISYDAIWSEEALLKLSKEIENKEIVSIEMKSPVITYDNNHTDFIETITYIDDNGDKAKIDCNDLDNLPKAHIKESDDGKYHITIDGNITVYIPEGKKYTSK